jgi:hypothetical protein
VKQKISAPKEMPPALHGPPEIIRIKVPREFGIDIDDMHVSFRRVANDGFVVLARRRVRFDVYA